MHPRSPAAVCLFAVLALFAGAWRAKDCLQRRRVGVWSHCHLHVGSSAVEDASWLWRSPSRASSLPAPVSGDREGRVQDGC